MKLHTILNEGRFGRYKGNFKRREMDHELGHEVNNWAIVFAGSKSFWKVVRSRRHAESIVATLRGKGKEVDFIETAAPVTS